MTPRQKAKLIDKVNEDYLQVGAKTNSKAIENYLKKVINEATKEGKSDKEIKNIVLKTPIDDKAYLLEVYSSLVLSGITNVIEKQRLDKEDKEVLEPILAILAFYGVRNTELIATKTNVLTKAVLTGRTNMLNKRDKKILPQFKIYYDNPQNAKTIKKMIPQAQKRIAKIHRQLKSNLSKEVIKDLKKQSKLRVEVKGELRPKTFNEIRKDLRGKYSSQVDYRVRRVVDTELKELQEQSKQAQHLVLGYTHKTWNTQLDKKVRPSHRKLQRKTIMVDKKFRVGSGWGLYPGDPSLPPKERINERCYLTYIKRQS